MRVPQDVSPELSPLYEWPLLSKEQEQHLFRQMNYLKYKAGQLARQADHAHREDRYRPCPYPGPGANRAAAAQGR